MKNSLKAVLIFSLVFPLLSLAGCSQYDNNGSFPSLFGPMRYAEPGYVSGNFNSTIKIWAKETKSGYSTEISSVCINIDPTNTNLVDYTSEPDYTYSYNDYGGYVYFYNIHPGRHMIKATHPDYDDTTEIINIPGDGAEHEYTIIMQAQGSTNQPGQAIDPDQYEAHNGYTSNNYFDYATDIDYLGTNDYGDVDLTFYSKNFNLDANFNNTDDVDWYKVTVSYYNNYFYGYIYVTLKNIPANSDYDVEIYDYNQYKLSGSYNSNTTDEQVSYYGGSIFYSGYFYVRVFRVSGDPTSSQYRLHIEGIK